MAEVIKNFPQDFADNTNPSDSNRIMIDGQESVSFETMKRLFAGNTDTAIVGQTIETSGVLLADSVNPSPVPTAPYKYLRYSASRWQYVFNLLNSAGLNVQGSINVQTGMKFFMNGKYYITQAGGTYIEDTGGGGSGAVDSVNGKTGKVILGANDIPYTDSYYTDESEEGTPALLNQDDYNTLVSTGSVQKNGRTYYNGYQIKQGQTVEAKLSLAGFGSLNIYGLVMADQPYWSGGYDGEIPVYLVYGEYRPFQVGLQTWYLIYLNGEGTVASALFPRGGFSRQPISILDPIFDSYDNGRSVEGILLSTVYNEVEKLKGQSGSGHTIVDAVGNTMPARSKLKFLNSIVTDNAAADQTEVTPQGVGSGIQSVNGMTGPNVELTADDIPINMWVGGDRAMPGLPYVLNTDQISELRAADKSITVEVNGTAVEFYKYYGVGNVIYPLKLADYTTFPYGDVGEEFILLPNQPFWEMSIKTTRDGIEAIFRYILGIATHISSQQNFWVLVNAESANDEFYTSISSQDTQTIDPKGGEDVWHDPVIGIYSFESAPLTFLFSLLAANLYNFINEVQNRAKTYDFDPENNSLDLGIHNQTFYLNGKNGMIYNLYPVECLEKQLYVKKANSGESYSIKIDAYSDTEYILNNGAILTDGVLTVNEQNNYFIKAIVFSTYNVSKRIVEINKL